MSEKVEGLKEGLGKPLLNCGSGQWEGSGDSTDHLGGFCLVLLYLCHCELYKADPTTLICLTVVVSLILFPGCLISQVPMKVVA